MGEAHNLSFSVLDLFNGRIEVLGTVDLGIRTLGAGLVLDVFLVDAHGLVDLVAERIVVAGAVKC